MPVLSPTAITFLHSLVASAVYCILYTALALLIPSYCCCHSLLCYYVFTYFEYGNYILVSSVNKSGLHSQKFCCTSHISKCLIYFQLFELIFDTSDKVTNEASETRQPRFQRFVAYRNFSNVSFTLNYLENSNYIRRIYQVKLTGVKSVNTSFFACRNFSF